MYTPSTSPSLRDTNSSPASTTSPAVTMMDERHEDSHEDFKDTGTISPLFKLPEELRLAIYGYALTAETPIRWPDDRNEANIAPALLRTCRKIQKEATPILYSTNTLQFQHPSDCNMFGWAHSPDYARQITSLELLIRDKDVRSLWTGYLGSTDVYRSLMADFPALSLLFIVFRSNFWLQLHGQAADKFTQWTSDPQLKDLRFSLMEKSPDTLRVQLSAHYRALSADVRNLLQHHELKNEFRANEDIGGICTGWGKMGNVDARLCLVPTGPL